MEAGASDSLSACRETEVTSIFASCSSERSASSAAEESGAAGSSPNASKASTAAWRHTSARRNGLAFLPLLPQSPKSVGSPAPDLSLRRLFEKPTRVNAYTPAHSPACDAGRISNRRGQGLGLRRCKVEAAHAEMIQ